MKYALVAIFLNGAVEIIDSTDFTTCIQAGEHALCLEEVVAVRCNSLTDSYILYDGLLSWRRNFVDEQGV